MNISDATQGLPVDPLYRALWLSAAASLPVCLALRFLPHGSVWSAEAILLGLGSALAARMARRKSNGRFGPLVEAQDDAGDPPVWRPAAAEAIGGLLTTLGRMATNAERLAEALTHSAARAGGALAVARAAHQSAQGADLAARTLSGALVQAEEQILSTRDVVGTVRRRTEEAERLIAGIVARVAEIADGVRMIEDLAVQTHLVALNAAIESARAAPAASALSPSAQEFNAISQQTARAARLLAEQTGAIERAGHSAAEAIGALGVEAARADELAQSAFQAARERLRASDELARDACDAAANARAAFAYADAIAAGLKLALAGAEDARECAAQARQEAERFGETAEAEAGPPRR